ncbi:hypothetical protein Tco_0417847 [Tanacetum coccineum]|uniref:Uncharacterized protein n=1 Tax=Tanacetum coccineum TaxID=301880 RepID=A0ABQ5AZH8_9ASTR
MNRWILEDDEGEEDPEMEEEMEEENDDDDDDAEVINPYEEARFPVKNNLDQPTRFRPDVFAPWPYSKGCQHTNSTTSTSLVKPYLTNVSEWANTVHSTLKMLMDGKCIHGKFDSEVKKPYVAPTAPVAPVDCADADDPSSRPTHHPRHDDPYVMVREL